MLEDVAQLKVGAACTAQNIVLLEIISMLFGKGLINTSDISTMLSKIESRSALLEHAPDAQRAVAEAALTLKHALLKTTQKFNQVFFDSTAQLALHGGSEFQQASAGVFAEHVRKPPAKQPWAGCRRDRRRTSLDESRAGTSAELPGYR
jgi:hypothetical protein